MKWKNIDIGAAYYYITATFVDWLPLNNNAEVRVIIADEIKRTLGELGGSLSAFVIMPDHLHLLVYLPDGKVLHKFNMRWRGRTARHIIKYTEDRGSTKTLDVFSQHANGECRYAVWKEQVRALPIYTKEKLYAMVDYIHFNPVRRGLVEHPGDWEFSSWRFYERKEDVGLDIQPLML